MSYITLTSEDTFYIGSSYYRKQVLPGALLIGEVVSVAKLRGEYKICAKYLEKGKLKFDVERVPEIFFKVRYQFPRDAKTDVQRPEETFGVEAICDAGWGSDGWEGSRYLIRDFGKLKWVPCLDCQVVGDGPARNVA